MPARQPGFRALLPLLLLSAPLALAGPEADLKDAVTALARTSHAWETTVRQRFNGENADPRPNLNAPLEVQGRFEPNGCTQITLLPSRELAAPMTVVFREGDVVAHTPVGWLRRTEIRQTPGPDREVEFEGKKLRLSRVFSVALKASAMRPVSEELFDLIGDAKSIRTADGLILAELRDAAVEKLWGDAQAKRAPEIQGTVIFKTTEQGLAEYHFVLAIGFPNSRTKKIAWSMQQWTTRINGIGSTRVDPPAGAMQALEQTK